MNMPQEELPIPDWKLERFLLGELPEAELHRIGRRMEGDRDLSARLQALKAGLRILDESHPASRMVEGIARRLRPRPAPAVRASVGSRLFRLKLPGMHVLAPAFGVILLIALVPFTPYSPFSNRNIGGTSVAPDPDGETTRLKGLEPRLILHRKTPEGAQRLRDGETAHAGDLIQVQYESAGRPYGALLSLDAEGKVTRHLPDRGDRGASLKSGGPVPLEFAYELDDVAGWERFYFITSDRPFDLDPVEAAIKRGSLSGGKPADRALLPQGLDQSTFTLLKEPGT